MTQLFRGGHLEQVVEYAGGMRKYRIFELDETGQRLTFDLAYAGGNLDRPLRFTAPYRRVR